mgnify:CR=1 FL=1
MEIKDEIVFIELRSFSKVLTNYMGSVMNEDLEKEMTFGACNRIRKMYEPDTNSFAISSFKRLIEIYDRGWTGRTFMGGGRKKSRKMRKSFLRKTHKKFTKI